MNKILLVIISVLYVSILFGSNPEYISPVKHSIRLAGNFMEIRGNHFHAGIDIKSSKGTIGDSIYSVHSGYISRIKIQSGGYGNVLYVDHPTGHTSVYAHLDEFTPEISEYIFAVQNDLKQFEIDIYLPDSMYNLQQGEYLGTMGVTGRSFGPHLHFELRETATEAPINPEKYGLGPGDHKNPVIQTVLLYEMDARHAIENTIVKYCRSDKAGCQLYGNVIQTEADFLALGIQAFDQMDGSSNKNGVYGIRMWVDDTLYFSWKADKFSFEEDKELKGFIDYFRNFRYSQKIYLLFNQLCLNITRDSIISEGVIHLPEGGTRNIRIEAYDLFNNTTSSQFTIQKESTKKNSESQFLPCDSTYTFDGQYFKLEVPESSFFHPIQWHVRESIEKINGQKVPVLEVLDENIAVRQELDIVVKPKALKATDKLTLASLDRNDRIVHYGLITSDSTTYTKVNKCGKFFLYRDDVRPQIEVITSPGRSNSGWRFRISDNIIPGHNAEDLKYSAYINDDWVLMMFDKKSNVLTISPEISIPNSTFTFRLIVEDGCGNNSEYEKVVE